MMQKGHFETPCQMAFRNKFYVLSYFLLDDLCWLLMSSRLSFLKFLANLSEQISVI